MPGIAQIVDPSWVAPERRDAYREARASTATARCVAVPDARGPIARIVDEDPGEFATAAGRDTSAWWASVAGTTNDARMLAVHAPGEPTSTRSHRQAGEHTV